MVNLELPSDAHKGNYMSETSGGAPSAPASAASTAPVDAAAPAEAEVSEDALAEVDAAEEAAEAKVAPKSTKKKFTPKVNGRQREVELDLSNDEEVLKYLSKAMAADEKFEEAASLRKNVEQLVNELKNNPRGVLSHPDLGLDLKKFAEDILNEEIEEMSKSPEQKKLEELEKKLKEEMTQREKMEAAKREADMARLEEQAFKQFDDDITSALSSSSLPKSPYVVKRIADVMIEAVNKGYTDVSVKDIMPIVEQQITGEIQKMFETMPEEVMEGLIGKQNLTRLRKKRLANMKKPVETANAVKPTGQKAADTKPADTKPKKFSDIFGKF